jgi:predicted nicotinamide N-methyase
MEVRTCDDNGGDDDDLDDLDDEEMWQAYCRSRVDELRGDASDKLGPKKPTQENENSAVATEQTVFERIVESTNRASWVDEHAETLTELEVLGKKLQLNHSLDMDMEKKALFVWDAGYAFLEYLEEGKHGMDFTSKRVLEIGAGTGVAGIALAKCFGCKVMLTDYAFLDLLRHNVERNCPDAHTAQVACLDWTLDIDETIGSFLPADIIVGCDIVYGQATFSKLIGTLLSLVTEDTIVLLALGNERRRTREHVFFLDQAAEHFVETSRRVVGGVIFVTLQQKKTHS